MSRAVCFMYFSSIFNLQSLQGQFMSWSSSAALILFRASSRHLDDGKTDSDSGFGPDAARGAGMYSSPNLWATETVAT